MRPRRANRSVLTVNPNVNSTQHFYLKRNLNLKRKKEKQYRCWWGFGDEWQRMLMRKPLAQCKSTRCVLDDRGTTFPRDVYEDGCLCG